MTTAPKAVVVAQALVAAVLELERSHLLRPAPTPLLLGLAAALLLQVLKIEVVPEIIVYLVLLLLLVAAVEVA
jgi:hypothetical protein